MGQIEVDAVNDEIIIDGKIYALIECWDCEKQFAEIAIIQSEHDGHLRCLPCHREHEEFEDQKDLPS